jgi:hypothetical protein
LLRSTSVEPRTVRAYCTQPVSVMEMISTPKATVSCALGNSARPTPAMSSATRMGGKLSITSHRRMRKAVDPAAEEAGQQAEHHADAIDSSTDTSPTTSEMRAP